MLVQLSVLKWTEKGGKKEFYSDPILIEDFLAWMEARYGCVIGGSQLARGKGPVTMEEHQAYRDNVRCTLKDRLREIGFYDDLSDAYNASAIRPRYPIGGRKGASDLSSAPDVHSRISLRVPTEDISSLGCARHWRSQKRAKESESHVALPGPVMEALCEARSER